MYALVMDLFWDCRASDADRAEVNAWVATNDCSHVDIIGINEAVVTAFPPDADQMVQGVAEMRRHHDSLSAALTAVTARLRSAL